MCFKNTRAIIRFLIWSDITECLLTDLQTYRLQQINIPRFPAFHKTGLWPRSPNAEHSQTFTKLHSRSLCDCVRVKEPLPTSGPTQATACVVPSGQPGQHGSAGHTLGTQDAMTMMCLLGMDLC